MANLKVTIVVRVAQDGKRRWVPAKGKGDPSGSYYLRYCQGKIPKYVKVKTGNTYDQAEIACMKLERKLKAQSQGFTVPDSTPDVTQHRITDVIAVYLAKLAEPKSDGDPTPIKSQNAAKSELEKFAAWCGKTYVEEIDRDVLIGFRHYLYAEGCQQNTVRNKMVQVLSWLKMNGVVPYKPLLIKGDLPKPKVTKPDPYSAEEWEAMKALATPDELLLIRFMRGTGFRNGETSVAERKDIVVKNSTIQVQRRKPKFNWKAKNDTAKREVPLPAALLKDLLKRGPGLLFPRNGHRDKHLLDIVKALALRAGVVPTSEKPDHEDEVNDNWVHRFRDSYITARVETAKDIQDLRTICQQIGHKDFETIDVYVKLRDLNDPRTRAAVDALDEEEPQTTDDNVIPIRKQA